MTTEQVHTEQRHDTRSIQKMILAIAAHCENILLLLILDWLVLRIGLRVK